MNKKLAELTEDELEQVTGGTNVPHDVRVFGSLRPHQIELSTLSE